MNYPNRVIKAGETDQNIVKTIQRKLVAVGTAVLDISGIFDLKTTAAVKQFQAMHLDRFHNPLVADGKVGAITWEALFGSDSVTIAIPATSELLSEAISVATGEIGTMEVPIGSNRGPRVEQYLASTGNSPGEYWCASFVYYCFKKAAKNLGVTNPLNKTAGCLSHWRNTTGQKITKAEAIDNPSLIRAGSIFIKDHGGGMGHTGIVVAVNGGFLETIEGNTNPNGNNNGIGVFRINFRKINSIEKGFIMY